MEKYGFVYIWYDRKHKRYYVGSHWGTENDGYICSSTWMIKAYKIRRDDFKRKIISRIYTNRKDLLEEEYRWLSMIPEECLGKSYYNLRNKLIGHWSTDEQKRMTIAEKISESHKKDPNWAHWSRGRIVSDETREKNRQATKRQFDNPEARNLASIKQSKVWTNPEYREHMSIVHRGKRSPCTQETNVNIRRAQIGKPGKPQSEEAKNKVREANKNKIYINNGIVTKQHSTLEQIPVGFIRGRIK